MPRCTADTTFTLPRCRSSPCGPVTAEINQTKPARPSVRCCWIYNTGARAPVSVETISGLVQLYPVADRCARGGFITSLAGGERSEKMKAPERSIESDIRSIDFYGVFTRTRHVTAVYLAHTSCHICTHVQRVSRRVFFTCNNFCCVRLFFTLLLHFGYCDDNGWRRFWNCFWKIKNFTL